MMLLLQAAVDAVHAAANTATNAAAAANNAADYLHAPSPLADQIGAAAISAWVIQQMKKSNLPVFKWVNDHNTLVMRAVSVGFAILSTSGIRAFWHGNGTSLLQGGTFVLNLADGWIYALQQSVWKTTQSFIMQQLVYQGVLKHEAGQQAADVVADVVKEHKEQIAAVVVKEGLRNDPTSLLKLTQDNPRDKKNAAPPAASPIEWNWDRK